MLRTVRFSCWAAIRAGTTRRRAAPSRGPAPNRATRRSRSRRGAAVRCEWRRPSPEGPRAGRTPSAMLGPTCHSVRLRRSTSSARSGPVATTTSCPACIAASINGSIGMECPKSGVLVNNTRIANPQNEDTGAPTIGPDSRQRAFRPWPLPQSGMCSLSHAARLVADARDSHASCTTSVSSLAVISPIRLARSRTDR